MPREANPCSKQVKPEEAYEVWQSQDGWYTTYVLKKYKSPKNEIKDPYAKWYVCTVTPNMPRGEYGDMYAGNVMVGSRKLSVNPLTGKDIPTIGEANGKE